MCINVKTIIKAAAIAATLIAIFSFLNCVGKNLDAMMSQHAEAK